MKKGWLSLLLKLILKLKKKESFFLWNQENGGGIFSFVRFSNYLRQRSGIGSCFLKYRCLDSYSFFLQCLPSDSAGGFHNRGTTIHHLLGDLRHRHESRLSVDGCVG